ncbi:MAG: hypothetical protein RLZZ401_2186, partial [Pseudomonadota bacterium]
MNRRHGFEVNILTAFAAAAVVIALLAVLAWKVASDATESARRVEHTYEVINNLTRTRAETVQIELSTQGFRVSGDPSRIVERDAAVAAREALLQQLQEQIADNPSRQAQWAELRQVIDARLEISREVERLRKT